MRLNLTVVDGRSGREVDALVDLDPTSSVRDLVAPFTGLLGDDVHPSFTRRVPMWLDGVEVAGDPSAGEAGLRNGSVVSLYEPGRAPVGSARHGVAELRVVSGPGAGRIHRLPLGETVVGCGGVGWSLPDLRLPADALTVSVLPDGSVTVRPSDKLDARIDEGPGSETFDEELPWEVGAYVLAGDTVLELAEVADATAEVTPRPAEALVDFNRPPRLLPPDRERKFHLPDPVTPVRNRPLPWVMVFAPLVIAVPMALVLGPRFLIFGLFSPVLAIANFVSDRRTNRKDMLVKQAEYVEQHAAVSGRIENALVAERRERRTGAPDPALLLATALGPGPRLWERRSSDPDYLRVRVGLADLPSTVTVEERRAKTEEAAPPRVLAGVPAWLDLVRLGVVGLAGDPDTSEPLARWTVAQVALLHSPRDVRVCVLSDKDGGERWNWVRWLPHARDDGSGTVWLGAGQDSVGRRLAELNSIIDERQELARERVRPVPDLLVVLDGARRLRALPAVVDLLRRGPAVGVMVLCLDDEVRQLPEECRAIVVCEAGRVRIEASGSEDTRDIVPDLVEPAWCEAVSRAVAPLRDTTPEEEAAGIPGSARLLDLVELDPPTPEALAERWTHGRTTDVVVGAGYDGPFRLDLRRDGPHALVAGTTGAGKSELLQTLVASLAVANRPDELTFVLVDYKGGSAFKDCARLPHTVGMVTDLDAHLVGRALVSLGAELRRREHLLAGPGAKDLEDYWALQRSQPDLPAIPRLVLVIDEFASLVAELPDFVQGLVGIAQRGRSLGIHLVLATQRPSGVVSADIRANTNLRIALRVTDENDSRDVIDAPDAARIQKSMPGRAFARSGASTLMPFQAGRVGGRRPDAAATARVPVPPLAWPVPWESVGLPAPSRPLAETVQTDEGETDLSVLVDAITTTSTRLGVPSQHRPWLDALPEVVLLEDLPEVVEETAPDVPAAAWMLEDLPASQQQRSRTFRLGRDGHLYVIGGPRSGRSTLMRTLAAALADQVAVRDLHVYGLDCGNGALLGLEALPHTGAVVTRAQTERADRLLARLVGLVEERQELLGRGGFADLAEYRATLPADERPPYVVFLLDRWDGFTFSLGEVDGGRLTEQVLRLLRDGTSVGVHVVVSGDRSLVTGRMSTLVEDRVVLRLADKGDYGIVGIPNRDVPETMPDGRTLTPDPVVEGQVAVLSADLSGAGQNDAVRRIADRHRDRDASTPRGLRPFTLQELPALLPLDEERRSQLARAVAGEGPGWTPMGVGGDDLDLVGLDLFATPVALVAGPPKSGRTNLLRFAVRAALDAGRPVLGICPVANDLWRDLEAHDAGLRSEGLDQETLVERLRQCGEGALVVVDDADMLKEGPLAPALLALVQQARAKRWRLVVAGSTAEIGSGYGGWIYELRKARQGLLLSPQATSDGDIYSLRLMRSALLPRTQPGRGLVIDAGGGQAMVQVPLV